MTTIDGSGGQRSGLRAWAAWILLGLAVAYALLVAVVYFGQRIMFYPSILVSSEAIALELDDSYQPVTVPTSDGETLKAFWKEPAAGAPVLLVFHGNLDVPQTYAQRFDEGVWDEMGYGVLAVAYRGYPGSTGTTTENGMILDAVAARRFVLERLPNADLVYYGHSLGSGVAIALSAMHPSLGLFVEAPYASMQEMAGIRMPLVPSFLVHDPIRSIDRLKHSKAEVIIVAHGDVDDSIPFSHSERLVATNPRAEHVKVVGAGHQSLLGKTDDMAAKAFVQSQAASR